MPRRFLLPRAGNSEESCRQDAEAHQAESLIACRFETPPSDVIWEGEREGIAERRGCEREKKGGTEWRRVAEGWKRDERTYNKGRERKNGRRV